MNLLPSACGAGDASAGVGTYPTLRSGGVRVSVWTRAACVKTSGLSAAHRRAPWNIRNKQRGLRQFRFRASGTS